MMPNQDGKIILSRYSPVSTVSYRKVVMPQDLNPADRLFGGRLLEWTDEACALYAMCQLRTRHLVTLKISESVFKKPVMQGDFLEFMCHVVKFGTTSLTVGCTVETKDLADEDRRDVVFTCEVVFVMINPDTGRPVAHGKQYVRKA